MGSGLPTVGGLRRQLKLNDFEIDDLTVDDVTAGNMTADSISIQNSGLSLESAATELYVTFDMGSTLTAHRTFTIMTGDSARVLDISAANVTIGAPGAALVAGASTSDMRSILQLGSTDTPTFAGLVGTTTADSATTGVIGQYMASTVTTGDAVVLSDDTSANVTSIGLTAGDWDIRGSVALKGSSTTTLFDARMSVSHTSATLDTSSPDRYQWYVQNTTIFGNGAEPSNPIPALRVTLTSTTTAYLVVNANFTSTGSCSAYGFISARRVR